jgi:hypothetical protein
MAEDQSHQPQATSHGEAVLSARGHVAAALDLALQVREQEIAAHLQKALDHLMEATDPLPRAHDE